MSGLSRLLIGIILLNLLAALFGALFLALRFGSRFTEQTCAPIWEQIAVEMNAVDCRGLGSNNACYGNSQVNKSFRPVNPVPVFDAPGDISPLAAFEAISAQPLDRARHQYGVAVLTMETALPGVMLGDVVTFILYGDSTLDPAPESAVRVSDTTATTPQMPAFYFYTGVGLTEQCLDLPEGDLPEGGLLIQSPVGYNVAFTANGAQIEIGSTILLQARQGQRMVVTVMEGHASVRVPGYGAAQTAYNAQAISVPLGGVNGLQAAGAPGTPYAVNQRDLGLSTVCRLIAWAGLQSPCQVAGQPALTPTFPPAPTVTPTLVPTLPAPVQPAGGGTLFIPPPTLAPAFVPPTTVPPVVIPPALPTATLLPFPMMVNFEMAGEARFNDKSGRYVAQVCSEAYVSFVNLSSGGNGRYVWDFGGRSRSQEIHPARYFAAGQTPLIYTITLTAFAHDGNAMSISRQLEVRYDPGCSVP